MNNLIRASKWKVNHRLHIYPDIGEWSRIIKGGVLSVRPNDDPDSILICLFTFTESENDLLWGHYKDIEIPLYGTQVRDTQDYIYITKQVSKLWHLFISDIERWKKYHKPVTQEKADEYIEKSMGMGKIPMFLINDLKHNKNEKY